MIASAVVAPGDDTEFAGCNVGVSFMHLSMQRIAFSLTEVVVTNKISKKVFRICRSASRALVGHVKHQIM